jgi:hypothetical protein
MSETDPTAGTLVSRSKTTVSVSLLLNPGARPFAAVMLVIDGGGCAPHEPVSVAESVDAIDDKSALLKFTDPTFVSEICNWSPFPDHAADMDSLYTLRRF